MPTTKKRLSLILPPELENLIPALAERDQMSESAKAVEILKVGLELEEDIYWENLAQSRDAANSTFVTHDQAWS